MNSTTQLLKLKNTLKTYNISLSVFIFVSCVENEELSLSEIGDKIDSTPAGMTNIRDIATDKNLVVEVSDKDRRKKVYTITDLGKELLASFRQ